MLVVSIGSILGSLALLVIIDRMHHRMLLITTCCALAVLFAVWGQCCWADVRYLYPRVASLSTRCLSWCIFSSFFLGPRTLVLIMGVEPFPTVYPGTFYGMAAAAAKVGVILIRPFSHWWSR
jgi:PHS family inorganic phosphate transporter-like MFS transporter